MKYQTYECREARCQKNLFIATIIFVLLLQAVNIVFHCYDESWEGQGIEGTTIMRLSNLIFSLICCLLLSGFNLFYSLSVMYLIRDNDKLKKKISFKVMFLMVIIQITLLVYVLSQVQLYLIETNNSDSNPMHTVSLIVFEVFGELLPIVVFCFSLLKQIRLFRRKKLKLERGDSSVSSDVNTFDLDTRMDSASFPMNPNVDSDERVKDFNPPYLQNMQSQVTNGSRDSQKEGNFMFGGGNKEQYDHRIYNKSIYESDAGNENIFDRKKSGFSGSPVRGNTHESVYI